MKTQLALGLFLTISSLYYLYEPKVQSGLEDHPAYSRFGEWMKKHNKSYGSFTQKMHRFKVYIENLRMIEEHNQSGSDVEMAENQFMDLEYREFKALMMNGHRKHSKGLLGASSNGDKVKYLNITDLPKEVDWRGKAVTSVKNQGTCGGCWAFSTAGAFEGAYAVHEKQLKDFSVQQIIDCCRINLYGCNGGDPIVAFEECMIRDGIMQAQDYPFTESHSRQCFYDQEKVEFKARDFAIVPQNNTDQMMMALTLGPVSICISDGPLFHFYNRGVLDHGNCGEDQDHCVLLTGYGTDSTNGKDYWMIKNSWGESWGEKGYIRIKRDVEGPSICGVSVEGSYAIF